LSGDAVRSPEVSAVRENVPEFEPAFQDELLAEDGELGAFQAMSLLADWTRDRLADSPEDAAARRVFDTVEQLITDERYPLGDALAAEFIEGIWDHPAAEALMGPRTRERARPSG
jgi:hypothetical protein